MADARPSLTPVNPSRAAEARDAAITLFAERGYRGTTINDIADVLGIRGPSLYKHVTSKQAILRDIVVTTMDLLLDGQRAAIAADPEPAVQLREMTRAVVLDHLVHRQRAYVCIHELANLEEEARAEVAAQRDAYWWGARSVIDAGIADGSFAVRSSAVTTFCWIELASSPASWYVDGISSLSHDEIADQLAEMALRLVGHRS